MRKLIRYQVLSSNNCNLLGYVYARDADHAWSLVERFYRCPKVILLGPGVVPAGEAVA